MRICGKLIEIYTCRGNFYFPLMCVFESIFCYKLCFCRQINLPMLPQGLQIMADQGFHNRPPVIVLPRFNQPNIPAQMRRYKLCILHEKLFKLVSMLLKIFFHCRTFRARRSMIERCFGIMKNSYCAVGTRRFRSRHWNGCVVMNLSAALYNRRKLIFKNLRIAGGLM